MCEVRRQGGAAIDPSAGLAAGLGGKRTLTTNAIELSVGAEELEIQMRVCSLSVSGRIFASCFVAPLGIRLVKLEARQFATTPGGLASLTGLGWLSTVLYNPPPLQAHKVAQGVGRFHTVQRQSALPRLLRLQV